MRTLGRAEAADTLWNWRGADATTDDSANSARRRGSLRGVIAIAAAGLFWVLDTPTLAMIVATIGAVTLLSALASPLGLYAVIERAIGRAAGLLGRITTVITLVPLFYLFFVPFGALFRRKRRDKLKRFYEPEADTYWIVRSERPAEAWTNQY